MNNKLIFIIKIVLLLYILAINLFNNHTFLGVMNSKYIKILLLFVITFASFYDITLAILLTVILIMNIILFETKFIIKGKTDVIIDQVKNNENVKNTKKVIPKVKDEDNEKEVDFIGFEKMPIFKPPTTMGIDFDDDDLPEDKGDSKIEESVDFDLNKDISPDLLPNSSMLDDMQNNAISSGNNSQYMSALSGVSFNDGFNGFDESLHNLYK
jgi:hypothetical protein